MYIYAHRGASASHPENTVEAFRAALEDGADGIETDLRLTADGEIVLAHDKTVKGVDGVRRTVSEETLDSLKRASKPGERGVATLEELVKAAGGLLGINLEVKAPEVVPHLAHYLGRIKDAVITSFDYGAVVEARKLYPEVPAGMVVESWGAKEADQAFTPGFSVLSLRGSIYTPMIHEGCRERGMKLNLWVVNNVHDAGRAGRAGADAVYTDKPAEMRKFFTEAGY